MEDIFRIYQVELGKFAASQDKPIKKDLISLTLFR